MLNPIDTFFSELTDPRTGRNTRNPLNEILLVAVVTLLCGGQGYDDMADTGRAKRDFLERYVPFKNGIPSEDTFRYVFMALDPKGFGDCFARWMHFLHGHVEGLVAIDGKCCRGSSKGRGQSPVNIVNAFCHERGVVLAAIDTPDKSNEITVLPELLRLLDIKGCVVTLDAMGCQKKVVAQIIEQKGHYLISLKGNQGNPHEDVAEFFDAREATAADFQEPGFEADVFEYEELDVYFGEDASRIRMGHAAKNLATLRRLCLNIARHAQVSFAKKRSVRRILRNCAMSDDFLVDTLERGLPFYAKDRQPA